MASSKGRAPTFPCRSRESWTLTGPATDAPREARSNAPARAVRSSSNTSSSSGRPSTSSGSWPRTRVRAPEADWMHPSGETSMVMAAEFWTSERSRASWSWTISYWRRWVRSRTVSRTAPSDSQVTGDPTSSISRHPVAVSRRISMGEPTRFSWTLANESRTSSRSSGWTRSRPLTPTESAMERPKVVSAVRLPHWRMPRGSTTITESGSSSSSRTRRCSLAASAWLGAGSSPIWVIPLYRPS